MELLNEIRSWYGLGYEISFCSWMGKDVLKVTHKDVYGNKKVMTQIMSESACEARYISAILFMTFEMDKEGFESIDITDI